jgi:CRP/FNR family transcriptional regulator, cyclic AMP receptor protein
VQQTFTPPEKKCLFCTRRRAGWFCSFSPPVLVEYDAIGTAMVLPPGSVLFTEGQTSRNVVMICDGRVKLTRVSREGKTLLVKISKAGDVVGLNAALRNFPYEVTAQAIETTHVRTFHAKDFLHFLERHSEGALHAAESLSKEYMSALNGACRLALAPTITARIAHLLLEFAVEEGTACSPNPEVHMALKHEDLASMLGTSRESVTRALNELKRGGLIKIRGTKVTLLRKGALERLFLDR